MVNMLSQIMITILNPLEQTRSNSLSANLLLEIIWWILELVKIFEDMSLQEKCKLPTIFFSLIKCYDQKILVLKKFTINLSIDFCR